MTGRLELIMGCMYSGKSTELLRRIRLYKMLNQNVMVVKPSLDDRYNTLKVCSHDMDEESAVVTETLSAISHTMEYQRASVICIDEGQFFDDIAAFVKSSVEDDGKQVIVACLDGTFDRKPFRNIVSLISYADDYVKLKALCSRCEDGTPACFSKRLTTDTSERLVGGLEMYTCVCRKHF